MLVAILAYRMPAPMAVLAFTNGAMFGLLPICWVIVNAMFLYNITVETGRFEQIKNSVAGLSADHRLQAVLIAFSFGAFLEGAAGGGTPSPSAPPCSWASASIHSWRPASVSLQTRRRSPTVGLERR